MNVQTDTKTAIAIIFAFAVVAGAILITNANVRALPVFAFFTEGNTASVAQRIPASSRLVYGAQDAKTILVEFSDFECPYCGTLHETLQRIVDESNGTISWEFRHLPLPIHKDAKIAAYYAECVAKETDSKGFFAYAHTLMQNQQLIDVPYLRTVALNQGVAMEKLDTCVEGDAVRAQVTLDTKTGQSLGGSGTPFTVIVYQDGTQKSVSGAVPYEQWKSYLGL